jgi:hypothetical protein
MPCWYWFLFLSFFPESLLARRCGAVLVVVPFLVVLSKKLARTARSGAPAVHRRVGNAVLVLVPFVTFLSSSLPAP